MPENMKENYVVLLGDEFHQDREGSVYLPSSSSSVFSMAGALQLWVSK